MSSDRIKLSSCFANQIEVGPRLPFATRTTSQSAPKVYASKFISTYQILWHPDRSCYQDKVNRVASRRASCHGFCSPSGQLYRDMTNPAHLSGPRHLDCLIMTRNFLPSTGTLPAFVKTSAFKAKTHANPDTDGNSLNRRAVMLKR